MDVHCKLRQIVSEAIPNLFVSVGDMADMPVRSVMDAVFDFAQAAISRRDVDSFVCCFKLFKDLQCLEKERSASVDNALHFSFFQKFDPHDAEALKILERLSSQTRRLLCHPFVYPHTWIRKCEISLLEDSDSRPVTVKEAARCTCRRVRQSPGSERFGIVEIEVVPSFESPVVVFENRLAESDSCSLCYLEGVVDGVKSGLEAVKKDGRFVLGVTVNLLALQYHDVDSKREDFEIAAREAVMQCLFESGLDDL